MKNVRKLLVVLFALTLLLALVACQKAADQKRAEKMVSGITDQITLYTDALTDAFMSGASSESSSLEGIVQEFTHQSLVMDQFQVDGEELPLSLSWKDDLISIQGEVPSDLVPPGDSSDSSRTLIKLFEKGMVTLVTKDDFTDAQVTPFDIEVEEQPFSLNLELLPELFSLEKEDLTVNTGTWVCSVSEERVEEISQTFMAILGLDEEDLDGAETLVLPELVAIDIDMSKYEETQTFSVKFFVTDTEKPLILYFSCHEKEGVKTMTLFAELKEISSTVEVSISVENERLTELVAEMRVLEDTENAIAVKLEYASPSEYVLGCNVEVDLPSALANGLMSEFGGPSLDSESCKLQLQCLLLNDAAGNVAKIGALGKLLSDEETVIDLDFVYAPGNLRQVGEACLQVGLAMQDAETKESTFALSAEMKAVSASEYRFDFSMDAAANEAQADSAEQDAVEGSVRIRLTDEVEISINDTEKLYLERSEKVFDNYKSVASWIRGLNKRAVEYVNSTGRYELQTVFYTRTADGFIYFTDIYQSDGQLYVQTECVVDYEDQLDLRAKNLANIVFHEKGELDNIAKTIKQKNMAQATGKRNLVPASPYVICAPIKGLEQYYVLWYSDGGVVTYTTGKPDPSYYRGYHMHWTDSDFNNIHDWEVSYDHECRKILTCKICGLQCYDDYDAYSHLNYTWETVKEATETEAAVSVRCCDRCNNTQIRFSDSRGKKATITLTALTEEDIFSFSYYGFEEEIPNDLPAMVIRSITFSTSNGLSFDKDIEIPLLEDILGCRIVAAYASIEKCDLGNCSIILPEGMLFFNLLGGGPVRAKTIVLPESLRFFRIGPMDMTLQEEPIFPES